jgi:hypothetical protein
MNAGKSSIYAASTSWFAAASVACAGAQSAVSTFRGVVIRLRQRDDEPPSAIDVVLEQGDPARPLFSSENTDEIVAEWQAWGRVLGLPLSSQSVTATCAYPSRASAPC